MSKFIDLTGQKFGRLTVIKRTESRITKSGQQKSMFLCKCDCGNKTYVEGSKLRNGHTKSCGCLHKEVFANITKRMNKTHGLSNTRLYHIWEGMKARCYNKNSKNYKDYGKRDIKIYNEWFNNYESFYNWAMTNGYKDNLTIDRIDVNGNYEPSNCRWISLKHQENNRRNNRYITYKNKTHTLSEWAEFLNISYNTLYNRIRRGWTIEKALTTKSKQL